MIYYYKIIKDFSDYTVIKFNKKRKEIELIDYEFNGIWR